ncbi:thermonuclease family protein [Candidatus Woesearchaeota archaeon]|nr:thermonuclease family protein [Candidatus Woesearchaeota archaeon]
MATISNKSRKGFVTLVSLLFLILIGAIVYYAEDNGIMTEKRSNNSKNLLNALNYSSIYDPTSQKNVTDRLTARETTQEPEIGSQRSSDARLPETQKKNVTDTTNKEELPLQQTHPSCQFKPIDDYRCSGNSLERKYQSSDCSFTWHYDSSCDYGCENSKCNIRSCQPTYVNEYLCSGSTLQKKYISSDCKITWVYDSYCPYGCEKSLCNQKPETTVLTVSYVSDGDTIQLSNGETVRLIGLNAPESGQPCSSEATTKLKELVNEKVITLEEDLSDKDQYGRLLRYVYVNNIFVNQEMVRLGFAHRYEYGSNTKYSIQIEQAENEARESDGCIWKISHQNYIQDRCVKITNFHFNAGGDDNYNLNDEYVTFENTCPYVLDMTSWTVKDNTASHLFIFPQFTLNSREMFTLYTGTGTDTSATLYWGRMSGDYAAIWNNNGDTLFLRDNIGNIVLTESYIGY